MAVTAVVWLVRGINILTQKIKPPIFLDLPVDLGIKKERLSIPNAGQNRRSMYEVIFNFIFYNSVILKTSAFFD